MFRRTQVFVGDHIPPHADHIDVLMERFIYWLNSPEAICMLLVAKDYVISLLYLKACNIGADPLIIE